MSVSHFARNTVDSLVTIRKLKEHGVACYFEKEGIYTFDGKYETLSKRYDAASTELDRLQAERTRFQQKDKSIGFFIRSLKMQPEVMDTWNDTIGTVMVERAVVHKDGSITFVFYNGAEVTA